MESKRLELVIFSTFFIILSVLTFYVFSPFLPVIALSAVLSVLFYQPYKKLLKFFNGGKSLVALLLVVVALVFLIIPILFLGLQIFGQAQNFFSVTLADQGQYIQTIQQNINIFVQNFIPNFTFNISDFIGNILDFVYGNFSGLLSETTFILFQTLLLLFTFFFFLRDGDRILDSFISLSPFKKEQNKEILDSLYKTINSVIHGTIFVGLIRFVLITIVFYFFKIPDPILWGSIGGIIGAIPGVGTAFVIIPAFLYLLFYSNIFLSLGMLVFGALLSFFVDNMLSAYFFGKGFDVPAIFILFSIIGGIFFFGPLGFIFGPIVFSLFISMVDMYKILVLNK